MSASDVEPVSEAGAPEPQPTGEPVELTTNGEGREPRLFKYFRAMAKQDASDLHFKAGTVPHIRLRTHLRPVKGKPVSGEDLETMVAEILTDQEKELFAREGSIDIAEEPPGSDRFRINIYRQRGQVAMAVRRVSREIPSFEALNLPPQVEKIASHGIGMVLVAGISGSGKSTTLAAMLQHINTTRNCHILTIEDPIEYLYEDARAMVNQREVGIDVADFRSALRYLTREDPDVVLIGEMRDHDTFQAALQVAETGHLVFGTIHSSSAPTVIARILDLYPADSRDLARQALASNLRAVICQRLLPCLAEGIDRVPAVEIMLVNAVVRQLIEEERDTELFDVIRSSEHEGMQDYTASLLQLIERDYIDPKVAYQVAPNPDELKMRLKGISSSRAGLLGR